MTGDAVPDAILNAEDPERVSESVGGSEPIRIPKDRAARERLMQMAGLTDEERLAIDQWCDLQARENARRHRRGLEQHGEEQMP